jgi:hypothetical protein
VRMCDRCLESREGNSSAPPHSDHSSSGVASSLHASLMSVRESDREVEEERPQLAEDVGAHREFTAEREGTINATEEGRRDNKERDDKRERGEEENAEDEVARRQSSLECMPPRRYASS